jgi:hypothetical protein
VSKKLRVGDKTVGSCGGYFGWDFYGYKKVIATGKVKGERWALFSLTDWVGEKKVHNLIALKGSELKAVEKEAEEQIEGLWEEE